MKEKEIVAMLASCLLLGTAVGCNSEKAHFSALECKNSNNAVVMPTGVDSAEYDGMTCVSYSAGGGELKLDLVNYWGNCAGINGYVEHVYENEVELMVRPPDCEELLNCSCPFDMNLSVDNEGAEDVKLEIGNYDCVTGNISCYDTVTLAIRESLSGMACQYQGSNNEMGLMFHRCSSDPIDDRPCADGLECAENGTTSGPAEICLAPCIMEAECSPSSALFCAEDNLCRIEKELVRICIE